MVHLTEEEYERLLHVDSTPHGRFNAALLEVARGLRHLLQFGELPAPKVEETFGVFGLLQEVKERIDSRAGQMHPVDKAFYNLVVTERNCANTLLSMTKADLEAARAQLTERDAARATLAEMYEARLASMQLAIDQLKITARVTINAASS